MSKGELSHREAFHRHLAHINNIREKFSLDKKTRFFERCRENSACTFNRQEKEVKQHLKELLREKHHIQQGGSCLDGGSDSCMETQGGRSSRISQNQASSHTQATAHDVAVKILEQQQPPYSRKHSKHRQSDIVEKQCSEYMNTNVNLPNINHRQKRYSIADPSQVMKQLAWMETSHIPHPPSHKPQPSKHKVSLQSQPNLVIISPVTSTSSLHNETVIKAEDINHDIPYPHPQNRRNSKAPIGHINIQPHMPAPSSAQKRIIDKESLKHYYDLLAENERLLREDNKDFEMPTEGHCPIQTIRRSNKRKLLALESLLMQLPSFKTKGPVMDPISCLNCRYLRLSKNNIFDLENECFNAGKDPGVHAHMDENRVLEYYDNKVKAQSGISLGSHIRRPSFK